MFNHVMNTIVYLLLNMMYLSEHLTEMTPKMFLIGDCSKIMYRYDVNMCMKLKKFYDSGLILDWKKIT
jgi:hypothetical protein